jgi:hypothetical protein
MIFPANQDSGEHAHDAIEIFYVVAGELEHVVNGKSQILKPGMSGFVRPPDKVRHKTGRPEQRWLSSGHPASRAGASPHAGPGSPSEESARSRFASRRLILTPRPGLH